MTIAGIAVDSFFNFAAWADANANKVLITEYLPAEQGFALGYLDGGTEEIGMQGTIADSVVAATGTCSKPSAQVADRGSMRSHSARPAERGSVVSALLVSGARSRATVAGLPEEEDRG